MTPAPEQLEVVADWLAECAICGTAHEFRWLSDDRRHGGTWAAVDGHWYEARDHDAARLLRAEAKRLREGSDE